MFIGSKILDDTLLLKRCDSSEARSGDVREVLVKQGFGPQLFFGALCTRSKSGSCEVNQASYLLLPVSRMSTQPAKSDSRQEQAHADEAL